MNSAEKRRWIHEFLLLEQNCLFAENILPTWGKRIVPGRVGEFSLLCFNLQAAEPLVYIAILREWGIPDEKLPEWAQTKVSQALAAAQLYISKGLGRYDNIDR